MGEPVCNRKPDPPLKDNPQTDMCTDPQQGDTTSLSSSLEHPQQWNLTMVSTDEAAAGHGSDLWQSLSPPELVGNRSFPTMPSMAYYSMAIAREQYPAMHRASNPLPHRSTAFETPSVHNNTIQSPPSSPWSRDSVAANLSSDLVNSILSPLFNPTSPPTLATAATVEQQMPPQSDSEATNSNMMGSGVSASSPIITEPQHEAPGAASSAQTKPPYDYKTLVIMALETGSAASDAGGANGMTISGIYGYITRNFPYYRSGRAPPTWRSRIRNVLTVNDCFCRIPDPRGGRKGKWLYERPSNAKPRVLAAPSASPHQDNSTATPSSSSNSSNRGGAGEGDNKATYLQRAYSTNAAYSQQTPRAAEPTSSPAEPGMGWVTFSSDDSRPTAGSYSHSVTTFSTLSRATSRGHATVGSTSAPDLLLRELDYGKRGPLSSGSLEMINLLAIELKNECSMFPHNFNNL